jgi:hypothetical protein
MNRRLLLTTARSTLHTLTLAIRVLEKQRPPKDGEIRYCLTILEGYLAHEGEREGEEIAEASSLPLFRDAPAK